jgi:hypothetical protein
MPVAVPEAVAERPKASVTVTVLVNDLIALTLQLSLAPLPVAHPDQEYDRGLCPPDVLAERETVHGLLGLLGWQLPPPETLTVGGPGWAGVGLGFGVTPGVGVAPGAGVGFGVGDGLGAWIATVASAVTELLAESVAVAWIVSEVAPSRLFW